VLAPSGASFRFAPRVDMSGFKLGAINFPKKMAGLQVYYFFACTFFAEIITKKQGAFNLRTTPKKTVHTLHISTTNIITSHYVTL
jgi:hypothetical protein